MPRVGWPRFELAAGALIQIVITFVCRWIPVAAGEPVVLRWCRVAVDHPLRTGLAIALVLVALRRGSPASSRARSFPPA